MAELLPPTGLRIESFVADNIIEWQRSDNSSVVGYNVYVSSTPGGGQSRFVRLNNTIVNIPDRVEDVVENEVIEAVETPIEGGNDRVEKVSITRQRIRRIPVFRFRHRNVDINSRLFYVVTSVDASGNESGFSAELTGETARIDAVILEPGRRIFGDIVNSFLDIILRRNPEIDLKPGTVVRDLVIDPQAFEMEKMWFFISFIDKSTSLMALRDIDDEDDDSITDPVPFSQFKQDLQAALSLSNDEDTQAVVDFAIEKLAANANVVRKRANRARGEALFFSEDRPVADVEIPVGTRVWTPANADGAVINFATSSTISVREVDVDTHFNAAKNRFEFPVLIEADDAGPSGNVSVGAIINTTAGVFSVTNPAPTFGGDFEESNSLFTERAVLKYSSLDVGTRKGYRRVLLEQPSVRNVFVVDAGHPLMQRDFIRFVGTDGNVRSEHIFGRVDLWVRGEESVIFEDRPSFLFSTVAGEQFQIIEFVGAFVIETTNLDVTEEKPIFEVLKITRRRAGVPDQDYLLDNLIVPDGGRRIEISTTDATNVAIGLLPDDTILVTYRFRGSDPIRLSNQPATSVISVEGLNSGPLDEGVHYEVLNQADFLLGGRSVRDTVSIQMKFDSRSRKPIGTVETFTEQEGNETGFVLGDDFKELSQRGILVDTISVVASPNNFEQLQLDSNIVQVADLSRNRDFETETDEGTGVTSIRLIGNEFPPGRYTVSYEFGETIIIRYRANNLISRLQGVVDESRHEAADVLAKASRPVDVDVIFSFKILETADEWHRTGCIYSMTSAPQGHQLPPGEWNVIEIAMEGLALSVTLNDTIVTTLDP
ncbi:MAG: baseplate J/gp47 family protein, partial [Proteobacteria bacterium]|nr:baseplate J/gp47 family protein [Pseudomonadota bacterium]